MSYCFWKELLGKGNNTLRYPFNAFKLASNPRRVAWLILECGVARLPQIKLYCRTNFTKEGYVSIARNLRTEYIL